MKKYKLSKYSQLTGFDDYDATDIPAKYTTGYFILSNPARDSEYIIPETVRYFIHKFSTPKSCADVVSEVATDLKKPAEGH